MGQLNHLREQLEELTGELDQAYRVPDAVLQPEVVRARALVEEARTVVASAFLSRRAMRLAQEAVNRVQAAVRRALEVSRLLRDRSAILRSQAEEYRVVSQEVLETGQDLKTVSQTLKEQLAREEPGQVVLESDIPSEHPAKAEIEAAVRDTVAAASGRWRVWIGVTALGSWWGLRVSGPAIDWVGTLQERDEQTPEGMRARLEPLVRLSLAEAQCRRSRRLARTRPGEHGQV